MSGAKVHNVLYEVKEYGENTMGEMEEMEEMETVGVRPIKPCLQIQFPRFTFCMQMST